jgi:hypothetical protein
VRAEVAGGVKPERRAPFNPSGCTTNCVNSVVAFLMSVKGGELNTASPHVAENLGSIARANSQIRTQAGVRFSTAEPQFSTLNSNNEKQFFVVYPGRSRTTASHVLVGVKNGNRTMLYDPQSGARTTDVAGLGAFYAFPVALE